MCRITTRISDRNRPGGRTRAARVSVDVAVVGGGPSGAVAARLLASWGHRVALLTRPTDPARALANSLPPSTQSVLGQAGLLEVIDRIGYRTHGNTVWWGDRDGRVEPFSPDCSAWGYQVDRALLDPLLLARAAQAGVHVETDARVQRVDLGESGVAISFTGSSGDGSCSARLVLDASGRAGVVAVSHRLRQHVAGGRMQALVGVWERPGGWFLQHPTHTFIETCDEGWSWSIPTTDVVRHVGIMVDGATSRVTRGASLEDTYRAQLALTPRIDRQVRGSTLSRVFACDATVYTARQHAGPGFLLLGDAGSTLNPLSSFGVKKALTSAWLGAVVAHTVLDHRDRAAVARAFFSEWAAGVWQVNLKRSRDFALEARRRHRSAFWQAQAAAVVDDARMPVDDDGLLRGAEVRRSLESLRAADRIVFSAPAPSTFVSAPIVRGHELVMEDAIALGPDTRHVLRYVRGLDLVEIVRLAPGSNDVPALYEAYVRRHGHVSLPDFLGSLSLLIARGVLRADAVATSPHL